MVNRLMYLNETALKIKIIAMLYERSAYVISFLVINW